MSKHMLTAQLGDFSGETKKNLPRKQIEELQQHQQLVRCVCICMSVLNVIMILHVVCFGVLQIDVECEYVWS